MTTRDLSSATPESVGLSAQGLERIDALIQSLIDKGVLAGAVTLTARHGKVVRTNAMGMKDIAAGEPLKTDTIFRIFSMTKPVTGTAMAILWDEGYWRPEDPIEKHLPEFADVRVFDGLDAGGDARTVACETRPTMGQLMTHTAGLQYGFDPQQPLDRIYQDAELWQSADLAEFARKVGSLPLAYQPGTKWIYSLSMDVQGAIIERLTDQTVPEFYRTRIFEPLGMVDTAFHTPPEKKPRLATLYRKSSEGVLKPTRNALASGDHESPPALAVAGGGLVSTAADYARFAQMLLNGGELMGARIVSAQALKQQMTNHLSGTVIGGGYGIGMQQIRPGFGYGWDGAVFYDPMAAGVPVGEGTYHWDGAAGTWFWVDPVNDLLFVGLIQLFSETAPPLQKISQTMMASAYLPSQHPPGMKLDLPPAWQDAIAAMA